MKQEAPELLRAINHNQDEFIALAVPKTHVVMKSNEKYVFQYGMVDLPFDLSRENFVSTYSRVWLTGSPCTTQSATMKMFGSIAGPTKPRSEYQFWNETRSTRAATRHQS